MRGVWIWCLSWVRKILQPLFHYCSLYIFQNFPKIVIVNECFNELKWRPLRGREFGKFFSKILKIVENVSNFNIFRLILCHQHFLKQYPWHLLCTVHSCSGSKMSPFPEFCPFWRGWDFRFLGNASSISATSCRSITRIL